MKKLNRELRQWERIYNTVRPHQSLGYYPATVPAAGFISEKGMKSVSNLLDDTRTSNGLPPCGKLVPMPKRNLRIVKRTPIALAICEACNMHFHSKQPVEDNAEIDMKIQFTKHKCKPVESSQGALRIVREAAENK